MVRWRDTTAEGQDWFAAMARRLEEREAPRVSVALLLGPDCAEMERSQRRNLEEGRVALVEAGWSAGLAEAGPAGYSAASCRRSGVPNPVRPTPS